MADVLIVEPDALLAETYAKALLKAGLRSRVAHSAQDAVNEVDKKLPKLVLLEVQLAAHNGIEFLYELRSHADWRHVQVVILSLVPQAELGLTPEIMEQLGIAAYFYKPQAKLAVLTSTVRKLIKPAKVS